MLSGLKKCMSALFAGAALAAGAHAAPQSAAGGMTATPAMWRVADADSEFILIGTFHILPASLNWRTEAFETAFADAEKVYFEVEADTPEARSIATRVMMMEGFNKNGDTLTAMLDEGDATKFRRIIRELGLPISGVDPMRPWQAFLTMSVQFIIKQGFDPGAGVDSVLIAEARTLGKDIHFFETLEEQLGFFTGFSPETEKTLLIMTIRDWEKQAAEFDDLFVAWRDGDADFIDEEMNGEMRDKAPEVYDTLILERNRKWADKIAADMESGEGKAVVAVGAAHLVGGADSVPAMLKAKGFEVSRYGDASAPANDNEPAEVKDAIGDLLEAVGE